MPPAPTLRWTLLLAALCAIGCNDAGPQFELDELLHAANGLTSQQSASIDASLADLFGSPDEPRLPEDLPRLAQLVDLEALQQAAGPVISHTPGVTQGLYRRHCARCHGVTGNGRGPTALYQAPYPRDFRRGVFKWKSTYRDAAPTTDDLHAVLEHGVPGTAMPSFARLTQNERDLLRQYVQYLAVRGQTERVLVAYVADELPIEHPLELVYEQRGEVLAEYVAPILDGWFDAENRRLEPEIAPVAATTEQVALGRELYHGERAGCYKCHGAKGRGGAVAGRDYEIDHDDWNRDLVASQSNNAVGRLLASDFPPRRAIPRALVGSTLHGGSTPEDLFRRLHQGIAGTPMPAVGGLSPETKGTLGDDEIVSLSAYVETLLAVRPDADLLPLAVSR